MTSVRVTPRAARDLEAISRWTVQVWGPERMQSYLPRMNARFDWLATHPGAGRQRDDVGKGYRSLPEGRHVIFYIEAQAHIAIIGIPHQAMDFERYFD